MKNIEIKVYNLDGTFKETLKSGDKVSDFRYSWAINQGQGQAEMELNRPFSDTGIIHGDIIRVYLFSDDYEDWLLIYTGIVNRIARKFTSNIETVTITALGLGSLMNQINYYSGASYTFAVNQDPSTTIKAIVDYFNTKYTGGWFSYSEGLVETYWSNINIAFDYTKCGDAIKKTVLPTEWYWIINANWQVQFSPKSVSAIHKFTINKDVEEIITTEDGERIVNKYFLTWSGGTNSWTDATSVATYWLRELKEENTDIWDSWSANIAIASYIAKNKDPKKKTTLVVNKNYWSLVTNWMWNDAYIWDDSWTWFDNWGGGTIETIKPWDTVKVLNFDYSITNLQIVKIDYTFDKVKIELEDFDTLSKEIFS